MNRKQFLLTSVAILYALIAGAALNNILHVPSAQAQAMRTDLFAQVQAAEKEPIAYVGHGGFFDQDGKQIALTLEFVAKAQDWYRRKLLSTLTEGKRAEFAKFEKRLNASVNLSVKAEGQTRLVVQQHLLDWLVANSKEIGSDGRTVGKLNALKYALHWKIPERANPEKFQYDEEFKIDPELEKKLKSPEFKSGGFKVQSATINQGQAYINECIAAGVPIPPPIGQLDPAGLTGWKSQGFIPQNQQFIVGSPAEVRTFQSSSPVGMCFALPRYTNNAKTTVALDGVICLGQASSKVCIWDNQMNGNGFPFPSGTQIPIGVPNLTINPAGQYQGGGFELNNGSGGICTDCHAGQNPYIIHPDANLGSGVFMGNLNPPPHSLTFSASRYDPLVSASWPQNQLSMSPPYVPVVCSGCHQAGGSGGAFPHLSTVLPDYCGTILRSAIGALPLGSTNPLPTMPQGAPGSSVCTPNLPSSDPRFRACTPMMTASCNPPGSTLAPSDPLYLQCTPEMNTFLSWCGVPANSGPSDRGDPHLTTTNGINYDFQAAGEFTALRNSATGFELQTRQTPVATTFTPGANPYTGLASCVSLNTAVAVRVGKHRITYQPIRGKLVSAEQLQLRIDSALVSLPKKGINLGNGNLITRADSSGGLDINLSDGTHLIITPNFWTSEGYWYLNVDVVNTPSREGTMGHIPVANWLPLAPNGSSFGSAPVSLVDRHVLLNNKFADAWRVTKTTSLFDYAPGTSTDDFTNREWPPKPGESCRVAGATRPLAEPMKPELARRLCRTIKDKVIFENCVFDATVTGDKGVVDAYLRSLKLKRAPATGIP
ncbi:MAG: hypothetical protein V7641_3506 [Blastocatellia bacterium]